MPTHNRNQEGQSTVEFIITFVFGVTIIFVIFNSAINYSTGYLVHYATYMASRVYLTQDNHLGIIGGVETSLTTAKLPAETAFQNYKLEYLGVPQGNFKVNEVRAGNAGEYLVVGALTRFEQKIDFIGQFAGNQKLELVSESFLGKEPTRTACATRTCFAITGSESCNQNYDITLYDDGC